MRKDVKGRHTALHRLPLTLPAVLVRFGVAAGPLCIPIAAVVSVAAPVDGHGGQRLGSRPANAGFRQTWVDSCSLVVEIAPQLF